MNFHVVFLLSSYLLIFLGQAGLFLTEELSSPYLLFAALATLLGATRELKGARDVLPSWIANIAILLVLALSLFSIFFLQALPLQELVHFLLALQAVKIVAAKKGRDWLQLYLLSFFSLLAASALTVEISFAAIFLCYLFAAPWVLVLFHLKSATEAAGKSPDAEARLVSWSLLRLVGALDLVLLALTVFFFISFPRLSAGFFGNAWATGSGVTGFSDRLALGEVAEIQKNNAVAMRVIMEQAGPRDGAELYWRGVTLDLFDGRRWQKSRGDIAPLRRFGETYVVDESPPDASSLVRQRITLEPLGSPALFTLSAPVAISGRLPYLFRDSLGNLQTAYPPPFQISYEVLSRPEEGWKEKTLAGNALQLPSVDPRILQLARRTTDEIPEPSGKARALERHLRENYRYSLQGLPVGGEEPLADFLFEARQGNCEYFASALAVMLRSLGIPARVVNGYLGAEWNPYGEYYVIRQSNAHSWVEAHFADQGWMRFDPTPAIPRPSRRSLFSSFTHFVDFLRMRWYRHVVNFTFMDQYELFTAIRQPNKWFEPGLRGRSVREMLRALPAPGGWWMGLALLLACLVVAWKRLRSRAKRGARVAGLAYQATERYRRLLDILKKRQLIKNSGETADEFSRRAEAGGIGPVGEFTSLYQKSRFSGERDFTRELGRMDQILVQLGK